jgi:penicillin-binding protein 1A
MSASADDSQAPRRKPRHRWLRWAAVGLLAGLGAGAVAGIVLSGFIELPAVEALTTYRPSSATVVRARDGSQLATFALERRIPLSSEQIPQVFRDAVVAVEDANFYRHTGVDPRGILRAVVRNVLARRSTGQGGSTITQQLARTLFLTPEKRWERKIKEALLAIEIEQRFSKDEIFTLWANQMNFGHGNYGVEAASRFYFGKPALELALPEAALLAGIPQRPTDLSPINRPERALARRNHVLRRMREEGMIDQAALARATAAPLGAEPHHDRNASAAYFVEEVRRSVEDRFGSRQMLEGGLTVETTLDPALQLLAEQSLRDGLVELQRRLGWPGAKRNVLDLGGDVERWEEPGWPFLAWRPGELAFAVVTDVQSDRAAVRIAGRTAQLDRKAVAWTERTSLTRLVRRGDIVLVRLLQVPPDAAAPLAVGLEPEPNVEGAIIVLDNRTGALLALVGGFDFDRSQWDRAMQAARQCGSAFKPFVYVAALERGLQPSDTIFDGPVLLPDDKGELTYTPLNYERYYEGIVTLRRALEHSLNASAVKLQAMIGGDAVIDVARRLGVKATLAPYASMALGSFEITLVDLAASYAGIANRGQVAEPYLIARVRDHDGKPLDERRPVVRQALREDVAYVMVHMLEGVIDRGTGAKAAGLPANLAGKTGTTDDYTDAWFVGFSPRITCGVWVGRDMKERIGRRMTGAEAALPTWIAFMEAYLARQTEAVRAEEFPVPAGVVMVPVDRRTGLRVVPSCGTEGILEALLEGREPADCGPSWHDIAAMPWPQQLAFYEYKAGEPPTTVEAIAAAEQKLLGQDTDEKPAP